MIKLKYKKLYFLFLMSLNISSIRKKDNKNKIILISNFIPNVKKKSQKKI